MKYSGKIILILSILAFTACKKEPKKEEIRELEQISTDEIIDNLPEVTCYLYVKGKDSIQMMLEQENDSITGTLAYKFYEKDKSHGTLSGKINGDILKADYNFMAEGTTSIREVIFMKKGNSYVPGYGETLEKNGKFIFKENSKINFMDEQALKKVDCD
ncbi:MULTISPECIES: hypothetical protein [Galbibacter]|uniref:Lipoprotein n=1 Tax=Galbibacter pacificus TaxID=2996052 RepID=A0ABT6FQT2_9FLAO|nr:hypothetical protein [Galbibacter pacificus]MDG3581899.1 hypothetical protein [Galbibacter pacificus]MDG3585627.1 hypothetical protein [Galbibacter pacificus]